MESILRRFRHLAWLIAPVMALLVGAAGQGSTAAAVQFGNVTVQKQLVDAAGAVVLGDLSGYQFVLTSGGTPSNLPPTNAQGTTTISVAPGTYTITETARAGSTLLGFFVGGAPIGNVPVTAGQTVNIVARNQVAGNASITITKQIVDATGSVVAAADRSGFQFSVAGPGGFAQTVTSDADGSVTITNLPAGPYTVTEQPRTGWTLASMTINGVTVTNGQQFQVAAGGSTTVIANNRQGTATGTVTITKQIVDASGGVLGSADRSGFQFTIACGSNFTQTVTSDATGAATVSNVPAGSCTVNEASRTGFTLVSITSGGNTVGQGGAITISSGQTTALTVQNRQGAATGQTETVQLFSGCNNVSMTWPNGTATSVVAQAISPANALIAIWRFDNAGQRFTGYSPIPNAPNDLTTVNRFDAVFVCMNAAGSLTRPVI